MNSKNTKRALLSSVLAMLVCVALLIGTTFAWFTDTASTAVNKIRSGTLDVVLEMKNGEGNWVSAEGETLTFKTADNRAADKILWEPGCTYELPELRIRNNGNLALKYKVNITGIKGSAKLNEVIEWTIGDVALGTEQHLAVGGENEFTVKGHMLESAGNDYMNLTIDGIGITVVATQDTVESDSFGKTYDADAVYPIDSADSLKKSLDEVNASETVDDAVFTMGGNFEYSDETFEVAPSKNVTIDLAGKNLTLTNKLTDAFAVTDGSLTLANSGNGGKFVFNCNARNSDGIFVSNTEEGKTTTVNIESDVEFNVDPSANSGIHAYAPVGKAVINMKNASVKVSASAQITGVVADQNSELNVEDSVFDVKADFDSYSDGNDVVGILLWGQNGKQENISVNVKGNSVIKVGGKNAFAQGIQLGMKNGYSENLLVTVDGGKFILDPTENGKGYAFTTYKDIYGKFVMNGGEVSGNVTELALAYIGNVDLTVNGGNFAVDPSAYLAEGRTATKNGSLWTVK